MSKKSLLCLLLIILVLFISGCSKRSTENTINTRQSTAITQTTKKTPEISTTSETEYTTILEETTVIETTKADVSETTQNSYEDTSSISYDKHVGLWEYNINGDSGGGNVKLGIFSIDESSAEIILFKISPNYAHIAGTSKLVVPVKNSNMLELAFEDSFSNKCSGYAQLNEDSIYVKIDIDKADTPFIYGANVDATLYKKSDEVSKADFV